MEKPYVNKWKNFSADNYAKAVLNGERIALGKAITLVESNSPKKKNLADEILQNLMPHSGKSLRIGVSGPPGSGKSTMIETLGTMLCDEGKKVAVLAVDPSSSISGGSIMGDKTRMEELSRRENAFIRPSASGGTLGGVARKTRETVILCEAAGYEVVFIETIGVGQSEITVRSMTDFFMLALLPGSGDELQGIKKGVVEIADMIAVNKADGNALALANSTKNSYEKALHLLAPATEGWQTKAFACSALKREGVREIWENITEFEKNTKKSGVFDKRRKEQAKEWMRSMIEEKLKNDFFGATEVSSSYREIEKLVALGEISPAKAMEILFEKYNK